MSTKTIDCQIDGVRKKVPIGTLVWKSEYSVHDSGRCAEDTPPKEVRVESLSRYYVEHVFSSQDEAYKNYAKRLEYCVIYTDCAVLDIDAFVKKVVKHAKHSEHVAKLHSKFDLYKNARREYVQSMSNIRDN